MWRGCIYRALRIRSLYGGLGVRRLVWVLLAVLLLGGQAAAEEILVQIRIRGEMTEGQGVGLSQP